MHLLHCSNDPRSRYSHYFAEILRSEGFVDFAEAELEAVNFEQLAAHDLVLLPRLTPTGTQVEQLTHYVRQGGALIACLPAPILTRQFGLQARYRGLEDGYLHLDSSAAINQGLSMEPVQVVVPAVAWTLPKEDVRVLATIHTQRDAAAGESVLGAVAVRCGHGQAVFIAYDLPHAVARLRQGNPDHADFSFAGLDGIYRPSELFVHQLEVEQMRLPQADLQTAWLARLVETLAPRPRLWYYPKAEQTSVMVMTSDDDWSTLEQFETLIAGLKQRAAHCTFYVVPQSHLTRAHVERWEREGHTFAVHPAADADVTSGLAHEEEQRHLVPLMLRTNISRHRREFGRTPRTIRQHAVRWLGYVEAARHLADLGIRMDLNYLSVHPFSLGYMIGSGRPLRFVETNGALIACYQQPTLWTEEVLIHPQFVFSFKWTVDKALAETAQIIQQAARVFYTPVTINSHPVSFATYSGTLVEGCWDSAVLEGMPILAAEEWLDWTEARNGVRIQMDDTGFTLTTAHDLPELTVLVPANLAVSAANSSTEKHERWGRTYTTLTLRSLSRGEQRRIAVKTNKNP